MKNDTSAERLEQMMKRPIPKKKVGIVKLQMVKEGRSLYGMKRFGSPKEAAEMVEPLFTMADREMFLVLSLNTRLEPLALEIAAVGGLNCCGVDMRDIFKHALLNNGAFLICMHNHPSGDAKPSEEDVRMTRRLEKAGKLLGIPLVDHIIVGEQGEWFSFKEEGRLCGPDGGEVA